ncbi:putative monooxygenase [Saccharomycopsis crataegensis]|uniref:5-demethoxyubiquinone hydroxylase, mitochondrial n=1 Tax=Saccharomycopsis crataegensis TaxID=43959 RepID=A0AAV5QIC1_9ASCO|nr:putative monooxygenase [Saccharomycopsis crataegensis]
MSSLLRCNRLGSKGRFFPSKQFSTLTKISQQVAQEKESKLTEVSQREAKAKAEKEALLKGKKFVNFNGSQQDFLNKVIRVDQAGELGANYIYQGQMFALVAKYPHLRPVLKHMWEQEVYHHNTFNALQVRHRVRPSLLTPIWKVGAMGIGFVTGAISKEAAMACTVAVETVIGGHYNEQLRTLMNDYGNIDLKDMAAGGAIIENQGGLVSDELERLKATIKEFRDQELEHLDTAIEHDAESAVPYKVITEVIKAICRVSIWTAEKL